MTPDEYAVWVAQHVEACGADERAAAALLSDAVREVLCHGGRTTQAELVECTARLIRSRATPKFANEHGDAVGLELVRLREERRAAALPPPVAAPGDFAPDCPACGGTGLATVPLVDPRRPERDFVAGRRLVLAMGYRTVLAMCCLCDEPGCEAGRLARSRDARRMYTLSWLNSHYGCDLVRLLREYERERVAWFRGRPDFGPGSAVLAGLVARLRERAA